MNWRYAIYHFRWQTSGLVIAPFVYLMNWIGAPLVLGVIFGNAAGATIYWFIDKHLIFKK